MARQSLVWTALPNGLTADGTGLRLSVLLSPRLDPQGPAGSAPTLSAFFPDWQDWPATLAGARFEVTFNGRTVSVPATATAGPNRVDATLGAADSAVWKALFPGTVPVNAFAFADLSPSIMLSYDAGGMADAIEDLYRDLARAAQDRMPRVTELLETERWRGFINGVQQLDASSINPDLGVRDPGKQFDDLRRGRRAFLNPLERFQLFHTPPASPVIRHEARQHESRIDARWIEYKRADLPSPEAIAPQVDFHQIVAAMGSCPTLLRRLGLVVDLVLDAAAFTPSVAAALSVKVVFAPGPLQVPRTSDGEPHTQTQLTATRFEAVPDPAADMPVTARMLDLAAARFRLLQMDVDGAGMKAMNFARSLGRRMNVEDRVDPVTRHEDEVGAPALRTAGLMLVQAGRATTLSKRFADNKTSNAALQSQFGGGAGAVTLHAQDVIRGYRIDIWDSVTARWHSLCRRNARYELNHGAVVVDAVPEEECTVQLAATRSADPASNADILYLHEALVSWTGWSLAAPTPGRAIGRGDEVDRTSDSTEPMLPPGITFKSRFSPVKGSLPRLRFGRSYWIRVRAVDLAGNSLEPSGHDIANEQPLLHARPYLRYEPVAAPIVALLSAAGAIQRPLEGESMSRMAIRSFNDTPADNVVLTSQVARRVAAPPQVSVRDAEQHGMLDAGGAVDATLFNLLANQKDVDPRSPAAAIRQEKLLTSGPLDATPVETVFAVYEQSRSLTYLPDPLATEVAVRVFDHPNIDPATIVRIPLYPTGAWPEARPLVIEAYEDPHEAPYYDAATHCLRLPLPKAVRAKLRLSMTLPPDALPLLGVFQMLAPADQTAQRDRALNGQHWMLTPWTVIEAVHAVQRPLLAPDILSVSVMERSDGQTSAQPMIQVRCSVASTDRLDLYAEWHEPEDDATAADGPADRQRRDVAFHVKVTGPTEYAGAGTGSVAAGWPDHSITAPDQVGINMAVHQPVATKAHEFHDTRYRRIEYWFDATTKFREFLPAAMLTTMVDGKPVPTDTNVKVTGQRQVTWVPNAAPPPAPKVLYVVPTFGCRRDVDEQGILSSVRAGGGLRVYLDRGWNASGYGEMIGVVLPPKDFAGDPDQTPAGSPYKKYVTLWGNDPIWDSAFVPGVAPTLKNFPRARTAPDPAGSWLPPNAPPDERDQRPGPFAVSSLQPSGLQGRGGRVDVAPHDVFYDPQRQLWYCDIEITHGGAYFPFIRLALARYQPISSSGAHLSNVVLSDIIALTADRWLNVTPLADDGRVRVAVFGVGYDGSSGSTEASYAPASAHIDPLSGAVAMRRATPISERSVVEVWLEELDERWGDDFGWKRIDSPLVTQRVPRPASSGFVEQVTLQSVLGRSVPSIEPVARDIVSGAAQSHLSAHTLVDSLHLWQTLWDGDVTVPPPNGARRRLVIAEYEEYIVDDERPYDRTPTKTGRRMVFVEHVELA